MANFDQTEKALVSDALNVYLQVMQQQMPSKEIGKVVQVAKSVLEKMEQGGSQREGKGKGPGGISEEHFKNVCRTCPRLNPDGSCDDPITKKFPGKCDPIIKYERSKNQPK